jgi:hypothetical protein
MMREVSMHPVEPPESSRSEGTPLPTVAEQPESTSESSRIHLVVVTTRAVDGEDTGSTHPTIRTRFWHPRDRRWSENDFDSLEHARTLFIDESGWVLRQDQPLDAPLAREWIFEAHRVDFSRSSKEQILRDIGMTPDGVQRLLDQVNPHPPE